jgi:hypothetical protein
VPLTAGAEQRLLFGTARVTMYTCVELGGYKRTASGIWPYEGVVAIDRRVTSLGRPLPAGRGLPPALMRLGTRQRRFAGPGRL